MTNFSTELKRRRIYRIAAACAVLAGLPSALCLFFEPASAQQRIPDFSPARDIGWRVNRGAIVSSAAFRRTGIAYAVSLTGEPQPVTLDSNIFNKDHPLYAKNFADILHDPAVADLTNPNLQPWVVDALRAENERRLSGTPHEHPPDERCWPPGVPIAWAVPVDPTYFLQTPNEVLIINLHTNHLVRRVALNRPHSANPKPSWFGESVGHYENGDTLVVDTIGFNEKTFLDHFSTPHTGSLHIVERWKLIENGQAIELRLRVEDPGTFRAPYEMTQRLRRADEAWLEYACGENPFDPLNLGPIPQADLPDF